jgi:hypothetical protein
VVDSLLSKREALSSNSRTPNEKKNHNNYQLKQYLEERGKLVLCKCFGVSKRLQSLSLHVQLMME